MTHAGDYEASASFPLWLHIGYRTGLGRLGLGWQGSEPLSEHLRAHFGLGARQIALRDKQLGIQQ